MASRKHGGMIVDVGNVIIAHWLSSITPENFDTIDYNSIPETPMVFESLRRFNDLFGGNVTVVYKATGTADEKILSWLNQHQFIRRTGIPLDRVCRTLGGRDKTAHIDQKTCTFYGTTMVVDDRLEVLSYFVGKVPNLFLFRPQLREIHQFLHTGALDHVHVVNRWKQIVKIMKQ
jgi:hypothetical protein